jgi:predicted ATPase
VGGPVSAAVHRGERRSHEGELALQVQRGQALIAAKGYAWPGTVAAFERARELAEALGDTPLLSAALYGDWVGRYVRADFPSGLYRAEAFLAAAERVGDVAARLVAHRVLGTSHMIVGELGHARHHLERALALYRPDEHAGLTARFGHEPSIGARCYLAWTAWLSGHPDRAAVLCAEAEAAGRGVSHVNTLAYLHFHVAVPALLARRTALVEVHGRALGELAREHGLALWKAYATFFAGWCRAQRGEAGATAAMARGLAETRATGARLTLPLLLAEAAKMAAARGRAGEAEALLDEGVQELEATGQRCFGPELYRVRGELLLRGPPDRRAEGEVWFGRALAVAREQNARSWELRTATSLAHAWAARGERDKAQDLLAAAYGRFTEGFDTPDLRDARALLDQLD